MRSVFMAFVISVLAGTLWAQKVDNDEYDEDYEFPETKQVNLSLGLGLGFDYGGIGGKLALSPSPSVDIFAGVGWNIIGAGLNGGLTYKFMADKRVNPYISAMYGYNAVIYVDGSKERNKAYYGPTIGSGIQLHRKNGKFWNFGFTIPFRSKEFRDDYDALRNDPNIIIQNGDSGPPPFGISIGYHFPL
jgi:hypothetical protein